VVCTAQLGDHDQARDHHYQAAPVLSRRHHDLDTEASTCDSLGYIEHHDSHHEQAIRHYQQALTLRRNNGDTYHLANSLDGLGHPHAALGQHDQARAVWREAPESYQDQGRDEDAARLQQRLDNLDAHDGDQPPPTIKSAK
jgi:tetratricopeptide (TPR) repeat protein